MTKNNIIKSLATPFLSRFIFDKLINNSLFVFNYHDISENPSEFSLKYNLAVNPNLFVKQLKWIKKYFNVITPNDLLLGNYDKPSAIITFDDGFKSAFKIGADIISNENLTAINFVNMSPINGDIFWSGLVTYLCNYVPIFKEKMSIKYKNNTDKLFLYITYDDVYNFNFNESMTDLEEKARIYQGKFAEPSDLKESMNKNIYLGNHLYDHYNAANISEKKLTDLYLKNQSELNSYSNSTNFFSYPFGQPDSCYTRKTDDIIFSLGATRIFTAFALCNKDHNAKKLHRIALFNSINSEELFRVQCIIPNYFNKILCQHLFTYV